jgi:hypothetical protein
MWRAIGFNSDKKTKVLFNALDADGKKNLKYLQTALGRARLGRPGGSDKKTKVLFNALDADGKKNLKYLQTAIGRARLGRPGGSATAGREEIKKELRGGISQSLREWIRKPVSSLVGAGEDAAFNRRTSALAKALYDPTWKAEMKELRKLNPDSPAAARAFTQLLNDIESTEANNDQIESK